MIDTSFAGLFARFIATLLGVILAGGLMALCMYITDTFIEDEGWHTYWDMVCGLTIILYAIQLAVKL